MFGRILREGFVAGLAGAGAVAVWFFLVDLIGGNPFYTPSMLGSAVFSGPGGPSKSMTQPVVRMQPMENSVACANLELSVESM